MSKFWIYDPSILLKKDKILELWPKENLNMADKLNAVTRTILVMTTLGYLSSRSFNIIVSGIVTLVVIVALYKSKAKNNLENFDIREKAEEIKLLTSTLTKPTPKNPYMNFMMTDYVDEPNKKAALPSFNSAVEKKVNEAVVKNLDPRLFRDIGDAMGFDAFSRNFHTMPNTTNPNDQTAFAEFCYGNMKSCKEGDCFGYINSCPENNYSCKAAYKVDDELEDLDEEETELEQEAVGGGKMLNVTDLDSVTLDAFNNATAFYSQQSDGLQSTNYKKELSVILDANMSKPDKMKRSTYFKQAINTSGGAFGRQKASSVLI
jgi:hypothetical protein